MLPEVMPGIARPEPGAHRLSLVRQAAGTAPRTPPVRAGRRPNAFRFSRRANWAWGDNVSPPPAGSVRAALLRRSRTRCTSAGTSRNELSERRHYAPPVGGYSAVVLCRFCIPLSPTSLTIGSAKGQGL